MLVILQVYYTCNFAGTLVNLTVCKELLTPLRYLYTTRTLAPYMDICNSAMILGTYLYSFRIPSSCKNTCDFAETLVALPGY
jgi:hypothetical protein